VCRQPLGDALAARLPFPHVKQCASNANAAGLPSGRSMTAANFSLLTFENSNGSLRITDPSR
jgi:hypothetical protein